MIIITRFVLFIYLFICLRYLSSLLREDFSNARYMPINLHLLNNVYVQIKSFKNVWKINIIEYYLRLYDGMSYAVRVLRTHNKIKEIKSLIVTNLLLLIL